MEREFSLMEAFEKARQRANKIDSKVHYELSESVEDQTKEIIPEKMEIPDGYIYGVYKRSNKGYNKRILGNIPESEAKFWTNALNKREATKRSTMSEFPAEVLYYDYVKEGTKETSVYYNPEIIMINNS